MRNDQSSLTNTHRSFQGTSKIVTTCSPNAAARVQSRESMKKDIQI